MSSGGGYAAFCAANNAAMVAVNGMKSTIEQQQRTIQTYIERTNAQHRLIEDLRRSASEAIKQLQEQKVVTEKFKREFLQQEVLYVVV